MEQKLKPCPFCGGDVMIYYSSMTKGFYVTHRNGYESCFLITPALMHGDFKSLQDAHDAWNRRASNE